MINVIDNALPNDVFENLQKYCAENEFKIVQAGDKEFSVLEVPEQVKGLIELDGYEIILTFIRNAYKGFDSDYRIHSDHIINGQKPEIASVLYINNPEGVTPNGTAFWKHQQHGLRMPKDASEEEFDRMLTEDANDLSKWQQNAYISSEPNRMVMYDSSMFHSKYPNEIEIGQRIVLVAFYVKSKK